TTLFNQLTGANQHVGNFPGVTVDRRDGQIRGHANTLITDLPGIYSMSPYTSEEIVSRDFVIDGHPHAIINIVDATNIERNLNLTMQLLEMNRPMVVALNMMDEVAGNGGAIDINAMEEMLGVPVVGISAARNEGVDELVDHALHIAQYQERPEPRTFLAKDGSNAAIERGLHAVASLISDHAERTGLPLRFATSKAIEGDPLVIERLQLQGHELEALRHIAAQTELECGLDCNAAIADMRFSFIERLSLRCVTKPHESREHQRSQRIDKILTGKLTAIPMFIAIMATVFFLTFNVIGAFFQGLLEEGIAWFADFVDAALTSANVNEVIHGLIIGGIFEGVGSVLSFLPIVVTMFFFLSLLEDSGYIARVAFFMDKILRRIGLSGRSIVPLLIGFGCSVPAIMATRTLPSERDRRMTILLTPFMSCTAKLPIYAFFVSAFFPGKGGLIMTGLYLLGIVVGVLTAFVYKHTFFKGEAEPFVMELPNYRLPGPRSTAQLMWEKAKDFLVRAFSVILIATIVVWFLKSFDLQFNMVAEDAAEQSILAQVAGFIAPIMAPLGLDNWRICTALISGFMAKESVVSVLEVLYKAAGGVACALTSVQAGSMLIFSLLYTPCVAAVAAVKRELGNVWGLGMVVFQCGVAWLVALVFTLLAHALGWG
ncbi:MAG: ferrous iron transport protein B, partial [Coriobacteriales bacterium]|nr:ferrous iron transport protein B [Coriobacteriales bacterium]